MRVLCFNHTGLVSGAERSLLELVGGMAGSEVEVLVATPKGPLARHLAAAGVPHHAVPGTSGSFKLSPAGTSRALAEMARSALALRRLTRRTGADLVHANSIRAGLIAGLAGRAGGPPVIVHARDVLPEGRAADAVRAALRHTAAHVIAISAFVQRTLALGDRGPPVTTLHNPVDLRRFDPARVDRAAARAALGAVDEPLLGVLAQITPWKGQDDAIRILASLRRDESRARLLLVGEPKFVQKAVRFDNRRFNDDLLALANELGVAGAVSFLGEREDVPDVLAALDLVLVPSWEEPFGRTVIEGMAMGRAVLATSVGGPAEVITDGVDGRVLAPRDPAAWAGAARELLQDRDRRGRMETAARETAAQFDRGRYVERVVGVYEAVLATASSTTSRSRR